MTTNVYLSQRFSGGLRGQLPKTDWGVRVYNDRREYQNDSRTERVTGVAGNIAWRLAPRTNLGLNARWEESTFADQPDREDTLIRFGVDLRRDLGRGANASLLYSYRDRGSTWEELDFRENRLTATLTKVF